jgi:hypothetical protein
METIYEAALRYLGMGLNVIPLARGTKIPPNGFKLAKYLEEKATKKDLEEWFKSYVGCNIGIVTGQTSKICVVDSDTDKPIYNPEIESQYFPDSLITPESTTPSGGRHRFFRTPNGTRLQGMNGILPAIDFKCDGGYIVVPPSVLYDGKKYEWIADLSIGTVEFADLPSSFLNHLYKNNSFNNSIGDGNKTNVHSVTAVTKRYIWEEGTRDDNLYYVAQCLKDCGTEPDYILQVLRAVVASWGEQNEKWIEQKVGSAISHLERKNRNWQEDVDRFIAVTDGSFSVTDCYHALQAVTKLDKGAVRIALSRRKDKSIQKVGSKDGVYTKIDQKMEFIDFNEVDGVPYPVTLPMGLGNLVNTMSGNLILVAGEYNSGKTTFLMNVLQMNRNKLPIRYLSSEMDSEEFKLRFRGYGLPMNFWKPDDMLDYVKLKSHNDYHHCLKTDGLNIIDYLEFRESDYTLGAEIMKQIHDALGEGICVVGIQKKEGVRLPRSGDLVLEKPRLAVSLTKYPGEKDIIICEILKGKNVRMGKCDGKKAKFEILDLGSRFKELHSWCYGEFR